MKFEKLKKKKTNSIMKLMVKNKKKFGSNNMF